MKSENKVFIGSAVITLAIALWGIIGNDSFTKVANTLMKGLKSNFSWLYLITMLFFVIFSLVLAFSKYGKVRLGDDDDRPEYSLVSWFAMLFAAGMGVGLVFWGIAEPLSHYVDPMNGITPESTESIHFSIRSCFMHWGLHPWACYAIMGFSLAYIRFRRKKKFLVSNLFTSLLGENASSHPVGIIIDIFTTLLTVIGVATSFGVGCLQICAGLNYLFKIPENNKTYIVVIIVICICYLTSAVTGVSKGVKLLSNFNLILCGLLMVVAFIMGPSLDIVSNMVKGVGDYIINFIPDSLRLTSNGDGRWIQNWRIFYWAWWLSWAPFVGIFIARISKGRTIREFVLGVMIVPTILSILWFSVFSGVAFNVVDHFSTEQLIEMAAFPQTALFIIFGEYKYGMILSVIAIVLLVTFFVTSSDSATFVLSMLTSNGELEPSNKKKIFWGILMAIVAFALILSGGVTTVQTIAIVIAFPYLFILLGMCINFIKDLRKNEGK